MIWSLYEGFRRPWRRKIRTGSLSLPRKIDMLANLTSDGLQKFQSAHGSGLSLTTSSAALIERISLCRLCQANGLFHISPWATPWVHDRFEWIAGRRPASSVPINRAFGAGKGSLLTDPPRPLAWAGMIDAVGVANRVLWATQRTRCSVIL